MLQRATPLAELDSFAERYLFISRSFGAYLYSLIQMFALLGKLA